jgi:signal transduction histidine kinase
MKTFFAAARRTNKTELALEIEMASRHPVIQELLHTVGGLLAVLDEHRQVIALNDSFLRLLGITDPETTLGLRPGEAMRCVHADDEPAGCGTTRFCSSCGAAVAIVSSLTKNQPTDRLCALTVKQGETSVDMALAVHAAPIVINGKKFVMLFLQDITRQQQRAALERTFFHDISHMLGTLLFNVDRLAETEHPSPLSRHIQQLSLHLAREVGIQKLMIQSEAAEYQPAWQEISARRIWEDLCEMFSNHPVAHNRELRLGAPPADIGLRTDTSLLLRVLSNMVINAFEATAERGTVKVWTDQTDGSLTFCVWNQAMIAEAAARRIFQRNFSTKQEPGRGFGTYSMKLFGEKILGGRVNFTSSSDAGTVFRFSLPVINGNKQNTVPHIEPSKAGIKKEK